jgi:hypothetical protein
MLLGGQLDPRRPYPGPRQARPPKTPGERYSSIPSHQKLPYNSYRRDHRIVTTEHLKLIIGQLPEYDLHDVSHSEKVLKNMELLLTDEKIKTLSNYELFLLYTSAYLHDCAMALPEWENKILKITEGTEGFTEITSVNPLILDGKPPLSITQATHLIKDRANYLYKEFSTIKKFIFIQDSEEAFQIDLAERLIQYQEFRNGYINELNISIRERDPNKYQKYTEYIRHEFVRITHVTRIEEYIQNMSSLFEDRLCGSWGKELAEDLPLLSMGISVQNTDKYRSELCLLNYLKIEKIIGDNIKELQSVFDLQILKEVV